MLLLFLCLLSLLNFDQSRGQDSAVVDQGHCHFVIVDRLDELSFVGEVLSSLGGEEGPHSLGGSTTL